MPERRDRRLVDLFKEASKLTGSEHEAFIQRVREEDADLASSLEELLDLGKCPGRLGELAGRRGFYALGYTGEFLSLCLETIIRAHRCFEGLRLQETAPSLLLDCCREDLGTLKALNRKRRWDLDSRVGDEVVGELWPPGFRSAFERIAY